MLTAVLAVGQKQNVDEVKVKPPQFTGIENAIHVENQTANALLKNYLMERISYPGNAILTSKEGTEVVQFTITPEGNVADFKIINSVSTEIDDEVIWALRQTKGMWIPGKNNNESVDMTKEVSLVFCLDKESSKSTHEIFTEHAAEYFNDGCKMLFENKNPKKALKHYSLGLNYLPYDNSLLLLRGMCRYELGDTKGASQDWNRMTSEGGIDMSEYTFQLKDMKGYNELIASYPEKIFNNR
jgi:TonB family protein